MSEAEVVGCDWTDCSSSFPTIAALDQHLHKTHIKSQVISGCDHTKVFRDAHNLLTHSRYKHSHYKPYACIHPGCTKRFVQMHQMKKHSKTPHKNKLRSDEDAGPKEKKRKAPTRKRKKKRAKPEDDDEEYEEPARPSRVSQFRPIVVSPLNIRPISVSPLPVFDGVLISRVTPPPRPASVTGGHSLPAPNPSAIYVPVASRPTRVVASAPPVRTGSSSSSSSSNAYLSSSAGLTSAVEAELVELDDVDVNEAANVLLRVATPDKSLRLL